MSDERDLRMDSGSISADAPVGPLLLGRGAGAGQTRLAALLAAPSDWTPPPLHPEDGAPVVPRALAADFGWRIWRYDFTLPARNKGARYHLNGATWRVQTDPMADLRLAYTACNGSEAEDPAAPAPTRNLMWRDLAARHAEAPLALLLQGGDQLYADAVWSAHPALADWAEQPAEARLHAPLPAEAVQAARRFYWRRYLTLWSQPEMASLLAEVPSLMMWDDHDIFDGWGSHDEALQDCPAWQSVYACAREAFLLFQLGGTPEDPPDICRDTAGASLSWACRLGDLGLLAPDLRSERRPDRVLGGAGWAALAGDLAALADCSRVLVLSSVPALGPRLSWVERLMHLIPGAQRYEDDLRDQWQSRAHRAEWCRFLRTLNDFHTPARRVTVVSGEIHLATRGEMAARDGPLHQLVASGITHPPPPQGYARTLGVLAGFGEAPLPRHPITLHPLPGRRQRYTAERNYLLLARQDGQWAAQWQTEQGGPTPWLVLD